MKQVLIGLELTDVQEVLAGQPLYRSKQIYRAVYRERIGDLNRMSTLPKSLREELANRFVAGMPVLDKRYESSDGTKRYLLKLGDERTVEAVLMPEEARDTI